LDMQLDSPRIRAERERRAWSQEHLAEVSGLSLRTVQRVESSATGSFEIARALAAVFAVDLAGLQSPPSSPRRLRWRFAGLAASLMVALGAFVARDARSGEVAMAVTLSLDRQPASQHQLRTEEGKSARIELEGQVRLFINPMVTRDGAILLSMRVEVPSGNGWKEVEEPRIMVANGDQGTVKVTSPKGRVIEIAVRPRRM